MRRLAALLVLPGPHGTAAASVIDGDPLELAGERICLIGIDAPEGRQICQRNAREWGVR